MKRIYSTLAMLAMMLVAFSFVACGDDEDNDGSGGKTTGNNIKLELKKMII